MTFSISGRCGRTGMLGVAITTSSIAVASRCPWARAGTGAVATQNVTFPGFGPDILDRIEAGATAAAALQQATTGRPHLEHRQIVVIDAAGNTASYVGDKTLGTNAVAEGADCIAAGNLLADENVPAAMVAGFVARPDDHLAARLLRGLDAGLAAGGEVGSVKSAGLLVVHEQVWPLVDLRVDWDDDDPIGRLGDLWRAYEPQMMDYVARALDPDAAPSFGVPGDE